MSNTTIEGIRNVHDASPSATGYLFQCRYALLIGIQAIETSPNIAISIEKFDDVAFESNGDPLQLIQTKHHIAKSGSLTNASPDIWGTLFIWMKRVAEDIEEPFRTKFVLFTTAVAPQHSAAAHLRPNSRNEAEADKQLFKTASTSKNKENANAYKSYSALP